MSPIWWRGPRAIWLHHVHGPMWQMSLPPNLAKAGSLLEERIAPPFYRRSPVITLSQSSKQEMVEELGFKPERVTVIEPGIDPRFGPGGDRSPTPLVVAVGRLVPVKDFPRLIRVLHRVHQRVPELELVVVGEGYERDELAAQIADLDAGGWIRLAGRVSDDELISLYRRAWAVASTSIREGWGMTITEAAACGTPAVATRIAGHADGIVEGHSGLLGTTDDELVGQLEAVLTDPDLRGRLQRGALDRASALTWEATALGTFQVLAADAMRRRR
jgi:glycosyltransferase involved in cell wall biosynthesis